MTPQETALVTTLLERLKTTGGQPKDPEAETLIRQATSTQPDAAYYLAQTVLVHDLNLHSARDRIAELEKSLAEAKTAPSPPVSFLGGLLDTKQLAEPIPRAAESPARDALAAQIGNPTPSVSDAGVIGRIGPGDFLRAAAVTAAEVAGGAVLFEGIQSIFGHHDAAGLTDGRSIDAANPIGRDYDSGDDFHPPMR